MATTRKKTTAVEASPRVKLSQAFLKALEEDFQVYGRAVIETMREKDPTRYAELAGKLIMAVDQPSADGVDFNAAKTMQDIGRSLLKSVGCPEDFMSDAVVEETIAANDKFIATLQAIRARAEGDIH